MHHSALQAQDAIVVVVPHKERVVVPYAEGFANEVDVLLPIIGYELHRAELPRSYLGEAVVGDNRAAILKVATDCTIKEIVMRCVVVRSRRCRLKGYGSLGKEISSRAYGRLLRGFRCTNIQIICIVISEGISQCADRPSEVVGHGACLPHEGVFVEAEGVMFEVSGTEDELPLLVEVRAVVDDG